MAEEEDENRTNNQNNTSANSNANSSGNHEAPAEDSEFLDTPDDYSSD